MLYGFVSCEWGLRQISGTGRIAESSYSRNDSHKFNGTSSVLKVLNSWCLVTRGAMGR